jgi:hypothetical protein
MCVPEDDKHRAQNITGGMHTCRTLLSTGLEGAELVASPPLQAIEDQRTNQRCILIPTILQTCLLAMFSAASVFCDGSENSKPQSRQPCLL